MSRRLPPLPSSLPAFSRSAAGISNLSKVRSEFLQAPLGWGESPSSVGLLTQGVQQISVAGFAPWLYFVNAEVGLTLEM